MHAPARRLVFAAPALLLALIPAEGTASQSSPTVTNGGHMQAALKGKTVVLPLKHTDVAAEISGFVASVEVSQLFHNPYGEPIEARYVFPLPHRAAVHAMTIQVGKRTIRGVVKRRGQARAIYRRARARGRTAALLEQERPNIFTQSIANILPGDQIKVRIRYVEDLVPEGGRYAFCFPMVVGPRYVGGGEPLAGKSGTGWARDTTRIPDASRITPRLLAKGLRPGHDIALRLRINAGVPIAKLQVVTHRARVDNRGTVATVELDPRDAIPNKDFVVRYRLGGKQPQVALLAHRDRRGGHFLLMVQPQAAVRREEVARRELIFVVDNSGSMYGFPLTQAQAVVRRCLTALTSDDTFQIIKFAGSPDQFAPRAVPATRARVAQGIRYVGEMQGGGGTEFIPALKLALEAPKPADRSRIVLFITDGYIGYEHEVLRYLRGHSRGVNLFALGVGSSVNRFLIDGMARIGQGEPFYLLNTEKANHVVQRIFATISRPALTNIRVDWGGLDAVDLTPNHLPDLFAEKPVFVAGRYAKGGSATVTVRGLLAGRPFVRQVAVTLPHQPTGRDPAVAYLWARRRIAGWMDVLATNPDRAAQMERQVTGVALRYNLVSRFTSFVAVDDRVRNRSRTQLTVPVPVPLPDGVSPRAAPPRAHVGTGTARSPSGPGPDMDADGICDGDDRCPASPEVYNGFEDDDGCPDSGRVMVHKGRIEVLEKVYFPAGSARIHPASQPILDAIAATLRANPQIALLELQGHGDDTEPRGLALRRARAVRRYLIMRGVAASRLRARGYGATRPVDHRRSAAARSKNRRVEFLILRRGP